MKMIQSLKLALVSLGLSCSISSLAAQEEKTLISGYLMLADGNRKFQPMVMIGTNKQGFLLFKENAKSTRVYRERISKYPGIWLFEPKDVTDAKNLFESRKYKEALGAFKKLQVTYKNFKYLNDSYFETAEYYEMECYRKLKDYKSLSARLETYKPDRLTRPGIVAQTKLYRMYDAVEKKDWSRLQTMCDDNILDPELTLSQRAQVSYCLGLAYEGQKLNNEALNAFATAMTADFNRSESIVRDSALKSLGIFAADKEVTLAMSLWESADEDTNSAGYRKLAEANALARLYDTAGLGFGVALPAEYKKFQKFTSKEMVERLKAREAKLLEEDIDEVEEKGVKAKGKKNR